MTPSLQRGEARLDSARESMRRAAAHLLSRQAGEGYWWAELTADTTLEADYVLLELWLHPPAEARTGPARPPTSQATTGNSAEPGSVVRADSTKEAAWNPPSKARIAKAARSILSRQLPDGGFNIYAHGPSEISATIKAYTALKLAGLAPDDPNLARARERILALGGLQAANSYVKVNLSLFGLYPREHAPSIPPEMMLLGNAIYEMSSWTRAIVIPLSVLRSSNVQRPVPAGFTLDELFVSGASLTFSNNEAFLSWR